MNKKTRMRVLAIIIAVSVLFLVRSFMKSRNEEQAANGQAANGQPPIRRPANGMRTIGAGPERRQASQMMMRTRDEVRSTSPSRVMALRERLQQRRR